MQPSRSTTHKTALVAGSVALGAFVTGAVLRWLRQANLRAPAEVPPALEAEAGAFEAMEGTVRFYRRPGAGVPVVLLHSINAAGSSFEMRPLFEHLAAHTGRPLYALEWLGFGRSDRPAVRYTSALYQRHLRRFLSEHVREPADVVALSLACEIAADVAHTLPYLVRRLVLIAPTGLSGQEEGSASRRVLVRLAGTSGLFELFFDRLTRPEVLRQFYARQVFRRPEAVPAALVRYAETTARVKGAHHAPRFFVEGTLFSHGAARHAYTHLRVPTLIVAPAHAGGLVQDFDLLPAVLARNPEHLHAETLPGGLLPQWEAPTPLFERIDAFLAPPAAAF